MWIITWHSRFTDTAGRLPPIPQALACTLVLKLAVLFPDYQYAIERCDGNSKQAQAAQQGH
jgi:hypothetical protein